MKAAGCSDVVSGVIGNNQGGLGLQIEALVAGGDVESDDVFPEKDLVDGYGNDLGCRIGSVDDNLRVRELLISVEIAKPQVEPAYRSSNSDSKLGVLYLFGWRQIIFSHIVVCRRGTEDGK